MLPVVGSVWNDNLFVFINTAFSFIGLREMETPHLGSRSASRDQKFYFGPLNRQIPRPHSNMKAPIPGLYGHLG